jgi:hypothetical protein
MLIPYILTDQIRQVDGVLSVPTKDVELNIEEPQAVWVNDLGPLSVVGHILNNGLNIIDRVDAEVLDQVPLGFSLLPRRKDGLEPRPDSRQHYTSNHPQEVLIRKDGHHGRQHR